MPVAVPKGKPNLSRYAVEKILDHYSIDRTNHAVCIVGIEAYYLNTIGEANKNDRGVYDDALFVVTPKQFMAVNGNTDPSSYRKGYGIGEFKGMANLVPGAYYSWKLDYHKGQYLALCQRLGEMTVLRDGNPPYLQTSKWLGINNHKGGINTTASLGCQTVYPPQWKDYIELIEAELRLAYGSKEYNKVVVPYALIEETKRRTI